jgi:perosamine synthetase
MNQKKIQLFKVNYSKNFKILSDEIFQSGNLITGSYVNQFEKELALKLKVKTISVLDNASNAMMLALRLAGVKKGDEVIASPFNCLATNSTISWVGAKPIWVDSPANLVGIDIEDLKKVISKKTKAVILYHMAGYSANIKQVKEICDESNIQLIEDCTTAFSTHVDNNSLAGQFGDFSVFSFYANRQLHSIEGGGLVCKNEENQEKAIKLRKFGIDFKNFRSKNGEIIDDIDIKEIGYNCSMNNLNSAIGLIQLKDIQKKINITRKNAYLILNEINNFKGITPFEVLAGSNPSFWVLLIRLKKRNEFMEYLKDRGINASKLHCRNDTYSGFNSTRRDLKNVFNLSKEMLALPCGWWLDSSDIEYLLNTMKKFCD